MEEGITMNPGPRKGLDPNPDNAQLSKLILTLKEKEIKKIHDGLQVLRESIPKLTNKIQCNYLTIMVMQIITFLAGMGFIVYAIFSLFSGTLTWEVLGTGGMGLLTLAATLLNKPHLRLQRSMANLSKMQIVLYGWFAHLSNWDTFLSNITQTEENTEQVKMLIREAGDHISGKTKEFIDMMNSIMPKEEEDS